MFSHSKIALIALIIFFSSSFSLAEEKKKQGMPPAKVVAANVEKGMIAPESEFVGTVYYREVSEVASEVSGKVEEVGFEEGQNISGKDTVLVRLGSDLLLKDMEAAKANFDQTVSELNKARRNLKRAEELYKENLITESQYDTQRVLVETLELRSSSLKAEFDRLNIELGKKTITAPFEGIVIERHVDRGEWLSPGSVVATIADDSMLDITVDVPDSVVSFIKNNMNVSVSAGGEQIEGKVLAVIPRGEVSTRTFPVKIRAANTGSLKEGMEARATLPTGKKELSFTVPRDAVITKYGKTVIFTANDSKAHMVPVRVIGYDGMNAGISAEGLEEGTKVIIKGNERLREGQPVMIEK